MLPVLNIMSLAVFSLAAASIVAAPAGLRTDDGDDGAADGVARLVAPILEYTRWPVEPGTVRLCVLGPASHAAKLTRLALSPGRTAVRRDITADSAAIRASCDALYIGDLGLPALRAVTAGIRGSAIVTIAERDPDCRGETMFCMVFAPGRLSFMINIDAVSRSGVRIDPRVLRLAKGGR